MGIDLGVIESGGSVACNLFSLAIMSKFETIVLIGQDLAYPNKKGILQLLMIARVILI